MFAEWERLMKVEKYIDIDRSLAGQLLRETLRFRSTAVRRSSTQ